MASGIKLIKALHLHRQFLKISLHRLLRLWRNPNFVWEPPTFGGNAFGGFQNPLEFLGGNQCRGAKPRGNFFGKSNLVDPGRIGLPPRQCECRVIPLYYRPELSVVNFILFLPLVPPTTCPAHPRLSGFPRPPREG